MGKKIGFIGCGKIAPFHADTIRELGHNITCVANRTISDKVLNFRVEYGVSNLYTNWKEMLNKETLDAIWLITPWNQNNEILVDLIPYGIPIFAEKPVGVSSEEVKNLIALQKKFGTKIQVGHNRRFYDFIPSLKAKIESSKFRSVIVEIPETTEHLNEEGKEYLWMHNSSHVIDLLYYLVGPMEVQFASKNGILEKTMDSFDALLTTKKSVPVHINAIWNSPTNFSIRFFLDNRIYELRPIEFLNVYEGFDVLQPNEEVPVRRYNPRKIFSRYASSKGNSFKPGFFNQTKYFLEGPEGFSEEFESSSLEDMLLITELTEQLM